MRIPIGQFSKMVRLSIKALRLYADRGLLPPAQVDPATGYRYYEASQARCAEIIRLLRAVDMPLEDIAGVLAAAAPGAAKAQLAAHRRRLVDRLRAQHRVMAYLGSLLEEEKPATHDVALTTVDPRLVAGIRLRTTLKSLRNDVGRGFGRILEGIHRQQWLPAGPPLLVYHDLIDEENEGELEVCLPVQREIAGDGEVACRELAGGRVVGTVHHGPYEGMASAYHDAFAWLLRQGLEPDGAPREIYLNDPRVVRAEELQTRLELPVAAAS